MKVVSKSTSLLIFKTFMSFFKEFSINVSGTANLTQCIFDKNTSAALKFLYFVPGTVQTLDRRRF